MASGFYLGLIKRAFLETAFPPGANTCPAGGSPTAARNLRFGLLPFTHAELSSTKNSQEWHVGAETSRYSRNAFT